MTDTELDPLNDAERQILFEWLAERRRMMAGRYWVMRMFDDLQMSVLEARESAFDDDDEV